MQSKKKESAISRIPDSGLDGVLYLVWLKQTRPLGHGLQYFFADFVHRPWFGHAVFLCNDICLPGQ